MQTIDEFRVQFSRSSDADLARLAAAGAESLRPEAWQALNEELQRRRMPTYSSPYAPPSSSSILTTGKYAKAPVGQRFLAYLIDGIIAGAAFVAAAGYAFVQVNDRKQVDTTTGIFVAAAIVWGLYYTFAKDGFEAGQSFGKRAFNLMVVNVVTNRPCSLGESFGRNGIQALLGVIPIVGWLIEPLAVLLDENGRRLGDKAAGTQVIETRMYDRTRA